MSNRLAAREARPAAEALPLQGRTRWPLADSLPLGALSGILILAALLRFAALPERGLIYWDEAKFALEGLRLEGLLLGHHAALTGGKAIGTAKPSHALLIALAYAVFGVHDYAPLLLNAAAGVLMVGLVYAIAQRLFDSTVALVSALFLAVSQYDVIYSRAALSESDASAIFLIGVLIWVAERGADSRSGSARAAPFLAALLMGLAFTTNYRLIVYIGVLVGLDLAWSWYAFDRASALQRIRPWLLGLIAIPLLWQVVDIMARLGGVVLFRSEITLRPMWYLSQVLYQLHEGKQSVLHLSPGPYLQWFLLREGWLMFALLLCGLGLALRLRSFAWLTLAAPVLLPYGVYAFAPFIVPRNLEPVVPFASILAAAAAVTLAREVASAGAARLLIVLVCLVAGALGADRSWRLTAERSGYVRAVAYLAHHQAVRALTTSEIAAFYLEAPGVGCDAVPLPHGAEELSALVTAGYRYAVMDHYSWTLSRLVRDRMPRVARYPGLGSLALAENLIASENGLPPGAKGTIRYVDVYRLDAGRLPPPDAPPEACNSNRV